MNLNNNLYLLLSSLKVAVKHKNGCIKVIPSILNKNVLIALKRKGFVSHFTVSSDRKSLLVYLKNDYPGNVLKGLRFISVPSRRVYLTYEKLISNYRAQDFFLVFTSKGVLISDEVFLNKVGGELICDNLFYR
jgi:small subunit ribosomal protein S8